MKLRASAATLALISAPFAPAFAQKLEAPVVEPTPVAVQTAPIPTWAGGYAGAQLGWGWADTDNSSVETDDEGFIDGTRDTLEAIGTDGDGVTGGLHVGYLWQNGNFVYGGEAAYDWADIELDGAETGKLEGFGELKAKAGYSFGRTLVYGTGGAVYGDANLIGDDYNDWGWAAGAGVDYLLTEQISIGAEALYTDFGEFDDSNVDVSNTTLEARVSYRF